jgi:hypothetical protein
LFIAAQHIAATLLLADARQRGAAAATEERDLGDVEWGSSDPT